MLLTIFGAGASYDSVDLDVVPSMRNAVRHNTQFRPPLANQLFDERPEFVDAMNEYSQMSAIVPRLRRAAESGLAIETQLRDIQTEADSFPPRRSHLMALEFYLSEILDGPVRQWIRAAGRATNYAELIDQILRNTRDNPSLFVTFNYDRMLENAFTDVLGWEFSRSLLSYIAGGFALIKPHGSVNWAQVLQDTEILQDRINRAVGVFHHSPGGIAISDVINQAASLPFQDGRIIFRPDRGVPNLDPWHPAIAIPLDRSKTFVCPRSHLDRLNHDLEHVSRILIIGWRAAEQHFLNVLQARLPKNRPLSLCIVDKDDGAEATHWNLQAPMRQIITFDPVELHAGGFSEFVRQGKVLEWLVRPLGKF
jgi:hypothetical protein